MTPEELALALALIATPASAETFEDRWPHVNAVESTSAVMPPVIVVQELDRPPASRHRRRHRNGGSEAGDICSRHRMHKVITHGGKSWRCRK